MKTIGIDIGTTNTKVLLYDSSAATVLAKVSAVTPIVESSEWGKVRNAEELFSLVNLLILELSKNIDLSDVAGLSVSSVGEEIVLVDASGQVVCPIVPWFDPRSWDEQTRFIEEFGMNLFHGINPGSWYSLFKLLWLKKNHPRAIEETTIFTDVGSFILGRLSGSYVMDWSHASRTGAFDLELKAWSRDIIQASGLPTDIFPALVPPGTKIGVIEQELGDKLGLPPKVIVCSGGHDHFCAAYAGGVRNAGDALVSAGTSEACFILLEHPIPNVQSRFPVEQGCFVDQNLYYLMISIPSGHQFQQWKSLIYPTGEDEMIYAEMSSVPMGCDGHKFMLDDSLINWTLSGSSRFFDRGTIMRAIQEGLGRVSREVVQELFSFSEREGNLYVAGKPVKQPFWLNLRSEIYGRDLYVIPEVEAASLGVALMASAVTNILH